ncbi:YeeE/YedE family protein [Microbulbifer epialgicus]|uniref:YeeE/YedE family protein n=1 Tax=Microbulbifer epialgicus TaxID=393907 RepID=A0ABV4P560_9GAMM
MTIDWAAFTPATAFAGGALIGLASALLMAFNGRIAGISGIVGGILEGPASGIGWRLAFIVGLLIAPMIWQLFSAMPSIEIESSFPTLVAAGLLVGIGTRYGSGCTSGHGVCGLSRLSPRSLIATILFMATGFITVFVVRHLFAG